MSRIRSDEAIVRNREANHQSSDRTQTARFVDSESVYKEMSYDMADLLKQTPAYENTCAVRMSLALTQCPGGTGRNSSVGRIGLR